ncbi:MAG: thioredoxin [Pedosphaera sp.]|nr:thioredoxin [Pedosphaera sp.]
MNTQTLNQDNFDTTIASSPTPVLVDFWSEGCGPCRMLSPVLEELAAEQSGKAVIAKVNIGDSPELAVRFGITAVPTLIVFKNGQLVRTLRGVQSKRELLASLAAAT